MINRERKHILFLQTDWEMGMCRLARQLRNQGHAVRKVVFHTSDYYFGLWKIPVSIFRDHPDRWKEWLRALVKSEEIDMFIVYNEDRLYNTEAKEIARELGIEVIVTEQGLIRPLHVTVYSDQHWNLEKVQREWENVRQGKWEPPGILHLPPQTKSVSTRIKLLRFGFFGAISAATKFLFPHYREQQSVSVWYHGRAQLLGLYRMAKATISDRKYDAFFGGEMSGKYFVVPLQVPYDKQVVIHSPFIDIEDFLKTLVESFRLHAPQDAKLVIKIHPIDRGYREYSDLISETKTALGENRVFWVDRVDLDTLLFNSRGVITINSTVGLTGLRHGAPVIALGEAIYNLPGLTFQGELSEFWQMPEKPDLDEVQEFVKLLESTIQGRGTFSRKCFSDCGPSGIVWPEHLSEIFGNFDNKF